jgi:hypothetical protein
MSTLTEQQKAQGILTVRQEEQNQRSAFDELLTADLTPKIQLEFPYNINTDIVTTTLVASGAVTQSNSKAVIASGAAINSSATLISKRVLKYDPGQGALVRFSAIFTTGVAGSQQEVGLGDSTDGFFFGYNGADFGVLRRQNGVDNWIAQTSWNRDKADNKTVLPKIDFTKGNVFQIRFQWLGFGLISFWIENPSTGQPVRIHNMEYANANTNPSVFNPTLPLSVKSANTTNNTDIQIQTSSLAAFIEGKEVLLGSKNSKDNTKTGIGNTETNIITIRNRSTFASKTNRVDVELDFLGVAVDGTKNSIIKLIKNTTLGGTPTYTNISVDTSVVEFDVAGTTITGGEILLTFALQKVDSKELSLVGLNIDLIPGDILTVSGVSTTAATTDISASMSWIERF